MSAVDLLVEILQEPDPAVVGVLVAVARELDEVERVVDADRTREVADERDRRLEGADEHGLEARVVAGDLRAQLPDPRLELGGVEKHLPDAGVVDARLGQDAFWSPKRAASRSKSRS